MKSDSLVKIPLEVRFWTKVDASNGVNSCWEWRNPVAVNGYAQFRIGKTMVYAHRLAYEFVVGKIPEDLVIDHLCRNRACVNPRHLEPVTNKINLHRGDTFHAKNAAKTHCPKGHEYTAENTYIERAKHGNKRHCRICKAEAMKRFKNKG